MNSLSKELEVALICANCTSLQELTIEDPQCFDERLHPRRKLWDAMNLAPMQNLRTLTFRESAKGSVLWYIIVATEILDMISTSNLTSLNMVFDSDALRRLSGDLRGPSLKLFEQSVACFTSRQTAVSFFTTPPRKNRDTFWDPVLARAFPLLHNQGALRQTGQPSSFALQAVALTVKLTVSTEERTVLEGHQGLITDLVISSDGQLLVSSSDDGTIILWDVHRRIITRQWVAHHEMFYIVISPMERRIISTAGTLMNVWDISDGATRPDPIAEHTKESQLDRCFWSPNGEWIAFSETRERRKPGTAGVFIVHVWNAHTMIEHRVSSQEIGCDGRPNYMQLKGFSPDSCWLAWVAGKDSDPHYYVWNVGTNTDEPPRRVPPVAQPDATLGSFHSLSFDPQSRRTVTTQKSFDEMKDYRVRVWDNNTGELLVVMAGHSKDVVNACFSPDGARVLSRSVDGTAKVWDAGSGVCLLSLKGHEDALSSAIFSPDGCYIATASEDGIVRLWRGEDGECLATVAEHTNVVTHLVFSPDGRTLASGGVDGIVHIRDIKGSFSTDVS